MKNIVYKINHNQEIVKKEDLEKHKYYFINYYVDEKLKKTEYISEGKIKLIEYHLELQESIEEKILNTDLYTTKNFKYKLFEFENYDFYLVQRYKANKLESQSVIQENKENDLIIEVNKSNYDSKPPYSKTFFTPAIYSSLNSKKNRKSILQIEYYETGDYKSAYFSNENIKMNLDEFLHTNDFSERYQLKIDKNFFLSFNPCIPNTNFEFPIVEIKYFTTSFYSSKEEKILYKDIFSQPSFQKRIYVNNQVRVSEFFSNGKISSRIIYLMPYEKLENYISRIEKGIKTTFYFNPLEKKNTLIWEIVIYNENGVVINKKKETYNNHNQLISCEEIFNQDDISECPHKKYFYKNHYENQVLGIFSYLSDGSLSEKDYCYYFSESLWDDTVWLQPYLTEAAYHKRISSPFFDNFFTESPLKYEDKIEIIYRNHLGVTISEDEISNIYEYSIEVIINQFTKEIKTYKNKSCVHIEYYLDTDEDFSDYNFSTYEGYVIYRNKRFENNYIVYDIFQSKKVLQQFEFLNGILVQNSYGREITKVMFKNSEMDIDWARKTCYKNFKSFDNYLDKKTTVFFDSSKSISHYEDNDSLLSVEEFTNASFNWLNKINTSFYQSLFPFVPKQIITFDYEDLSLKKKFVKSKDNFDYEVINCFYDSSKKLKYVINDYNKRICFLKDLDEINLKLNELLFYDYFLFFFNIKLESNIIYANLQYHLETEENIFTVFEGNLTLDITNEKIDFNSNSKNFILNSFYFTGGVEKMYAFYINHERIWDTEISHYKLVLFLKEAVKPHPITTNLK